MGDLSKNFSREEFACKCGCGFDLVDKEHLFKLQVARTTARVPFPVNSGCRCKEHNMEEGGSSKSDHLTGEGTDVACSSSRNRFKIIEAAIDAGLNRIGIAKTFVHLGSNKDNTQLVMWVY